MSTSLPDDAKLSPSQRRPKVFILDDHHLVRQGLRDLLEQAGFEVVGESGSAVDAARTIPALKPDVAVLDVRLPDGTGIEVCRDVRSVDPGVQCLVLTSYDDDHALRGAVLAGASGYVLKQIGNNHLVESIRRIVAGESLFAPEVKERIRNGLRQAPTDPRLGSLTSQERTVLDLMGRGLTNRRISEELSVGEKTVSNYVSSILAKLGFERRTQSTVFGSRKQRLPSA